MSQKTSYEFLNQSDPTFRKKIYAMYVSVANLLDKYKEHTESTPKESQMSPEDFLEGNDYFIIKMFSDEVGCYESILYYMRKFVEEK